MKKAFFAAVMSAVLVMGSFALDFAGKINQFGSYDNVKTLSVMVYPQGGFPVVKSFNYEQIKSVTQSGDIITITADTDKYQYEMIITVDSVLDIKMTYVFDKKAGKKVANILVMITKNAKTDALGDYILNKIMTVDSILMMPGAVPGIRCIPLGAKKDKIDSVSKIGGDIINVKFKNKWEWFMPQGAYCMAFTCTNIAKGTTSLQFYGAGGSDNDGYAQVLADKLNSGSIQKILFYGKMIAPIDYDKDVVTASEEEGNYLSVVYKATSDKPEKQQAVGDEWYWDTFKLSDARFGLYKGTDFLMFY